MSLRALLIRALIVGWILPLCGSLMCGSLSCACELLSRMPEVVGDERVPLGIGLQNCNDPGVHIKAVYVGTPANRCKDEHTGEIVKLEVGDHVLAVNDETVSDYTQLIAKVKASPEEIHLQVRDQRTGKIRYLVTYLKGKSEPLAEEKKANVNAVSIDRLGISCHQCTEGIHIDSVNPNGPAARLSDAQGQTFTLKADDHILSLNGRILRSIQAFKLTVEEAPSSCSIRIKDKADGAIKEMRVQM